MSTTANALRALAVLGVAAFAVPAQAIPATPGPTASAAQSRPGDRVDLRGGFVCREGGTETRLSVETITGSLRTLSFRAIDGLSARVPAGSRGRRVGRLALASGPSERPRYDLRMPRRARGREVELLDDDGIRVAVRPGRRNLLTVSGLPRETDFAAIELVGAGLDVIHAKPSSRRVAYGLTTYRHDAPTATETTSQTCDPRPG